MSFRTGTQSPFRCVSPHLMGLNYPSRIKGYVHLKKKKKKMKRKEIQSLFTLLHDHGEPGEVL